MFFSLYFLFYKFSFYVYDQMKFKIIIFEIFYFDSINEFKIFHLNK